MEILTKPSGITINDFINNYKKINKCKKACFCGRLDPMARGQVLILKEDKCKEMPQYLNNNKIYEFEIMTGFQTQSDDFLGIIEKNSYDSFDLNTLEIYLNQNIKLFKIFNQKFHKFSSKKINGKSMIELTKSSELYTQPTHPVQINNLQILEQKKYNFEEWKKMMILIVDKINKSKDFNQNNIIKQWEKQQYNEYIYSIKVRISVTSGFYIRQFVRDLSTKLNYPFLTYDINRIKIIL